MAKSKTSFITSSAPMSGESAPRGVGGSYMIDPTTGVRTLVTPATAPSAPCCGPTDSAAADPDTESLAEAVPLEPDANEGGTLNG
jgi:hypothetical protein